MDDKKVLAVVAGKAITEEEIPVFLVKLGKAVADSGLDFEAWRAQNPDGIKKIAEEYLA